MFPGTITVSIDIDDVNEAPICAPLNYHVTIPENDPVYDEKFLTLLCFDGDSTTSGLNFPVLEYTVTREIQYPSGIDKTSDFTFEINTGLGLKNQLQVVTAKLPLDYESVTHYTLTVEAYDNLGASPSNTVTMAVYITIHNENDNEPVFDPIANCTISENQALGLLSPACSVTAQDADLEPYSSVTYRITSDSSSGKFSISSTGGQISLKEAIDSDAMTLSGTGDVFISLTVEACDCDANVTNRHCISDVIYIAGNCFE